MAQIAKSISPDDARHFAETKHDKLPEKASLDKTVEKAPNLEKQMTMDGQKQAITRRSWDDARFESVVGALSKVKVPKVKKPEKEEQTVDMSKSAYSTEAWDQLLKSLRTGGSPAALAGGLGVLGTGALGMGSALAGTGALAGAAYGAGQAPDKQKVRGAVQGVLPGAGAGFGLGAGTVGGTGLGAMLGMLLANKLKDNPTLALAAGLGSTIGGAGLGGYAGLKAGKGLGKAITKPIMGAPVDRANPEPEMKQAGCGGKKKKKMKKGK